MWTKGYGVSPSPQLSRMCSVVGAPAGGRCSLDGIGPEDSGSPTKAQSIASHGSPEGKPAAIGPSGIHNSWKKRESVSTHSPAQGPTLSSTHFPATAAPLLHLPPLSNSHQPNSPKETSDSDRGPSTGAQSLVSPGFPLSPPLPSCSGPLRGVAMSSVESARTVYGAGGRGLPAT